MNATTLPSPTAVAMGTTAASPRVPIAAKPSRSVLPGFGLSLGFTLTYLSLLVLIPIAALFLRAAGLGVDGIIHELSSARLQHALMLSFGGALAAAAINTVFGSL